MRNYEQAGDPFSFSRWLTALYAAKWALMIPFIILGGIYSGVFTPTKSAAVAAAVALVIGMLQRHIALADFPSMLGSSARVCGVVLPIIAVALLFAQALTVVDVPQKFVAWVTSFATTKDSVILLMLVHLGRRRHVHGGEPQHCHPGSADVPAIPVRLGCTRSTSRCS